MTDDDALIADLHLLGDSHSARSNSRRIATEAADRIVALTAINDTLRKADYDLLLRATKAEAALAALTRELREVDELVTQMRKRAEKAEAERDANAKDAERWRMLPAMEIEHQLNLLKLFRDIDAALKEQAMTDDDAPPTEAEIAVWRNHCKSVTGRANAGTALRYPDGSQQTAEEFIQYWRKVFPPLSAIDAALKAQTPEHPSSEQPPPEER